jgi:hypothetical protein
VLVEAVGACPELAEGCPPQLVLSGKNMNPSELVRAKREEILRIAEKHGASNVRLFGSIARGEDDEDSDIDLLVDLEKGKSLLDHAALMVDLEKLLDWQVDVFTVGTLKDRIRERVLQEAVPL